MINIILAVDEGYGIGKDNDLLCKIPNDMSYFKKMTSGNIVVMGRKTFESLPNKKILPNRVNIILSRAYKQKDLTIDEQLNQTINFYNENKIAIDNGEIPIKIYDIQTLLNVLKIFNKEIFIIGGEQIYKELLPYANTIYITKIKKTFKADKYFENIDNNEEWTLIEKSQTYTYNNIDYTFNIYKKNMY